MDTDTQAKTATDPVCGMKVDPHTAKHRATHEGRPYYFCSAGCKTKFEANPGQYLAREKAKPAPAKPGAIYTCPMHPEIEQEGPGDCPICGMALVPVGGAPADDSELRDLARRFWVGTVLSIPLVVLAMAPMAGIMEPFGLAPRPRGWVEFALGTPVVLWVGWPILVKFWRSLRGWSLNMYSLIGLGVGLAYLFSLAAVFVPGLFPQEFREHDGAVGTYFEAAAVIGDGFVDHVPAADLPSVLASNAPYMRFIALTEICPWVDSPARRQLIVRVPNQRVAMHADVLLCRPADHLLCLSIRESAFIVVTHLHLVFGGEFAEITCHNILYIGIGQQVGIS